MRLFENAGFDIMSFTYNSGVNLPLYHSRLFRHIPHGLTSRGAWVMMRVLPKLFNVQHVVEMQRRP